MGKIRVGLIFGGRSSEHSVSCVSASSVLAAIDRDRYDVTAIGIARDGRWVLASDDPRELQPRGRELPSVTDGTTVAIPADPTAGGLVLLEAVEGAARLEAFDVVFPLLHGAFGEDGTIQGLLEMAGIPYVGAGVFASAASMDKDHMKRMLQASGLPVGPYEVILDRQWRRDPEAALARCTRLALPLFVKPANGGSSIGITKVDRHEDLVSAIETAREHDTKVIVEAGVDGREIECGVLESLDGLGAEASLPAEIRLRATEGFYDFETKYLDDTAELIVPAEIGPELTKTVQELAVETFEAMGCKGLARVDFFVLGDGSVIINEINTMPGFTPVSMFPRMWAASGIDYPALVDRLIATALRC